MGPMSTAANTSQLSANTDHSLQNLAGTVVLCGAGKMGGALLEGWLQAGLAPARIAVIEPHVAPPIASLAARGVRINPSAAELHDAAAIVVAVKPQIAAEALPKLAPMIGTATVVVSIMAGRTLDFLAATLPRARARPRHHGRATAPCQRGAARPRPSPPHRQRRGRMGR
jgi:pyrroline-5-carboxylate reductase